MLGLAAVYGAIVTDFIRLGPSTYTLPEDALRVDVTWVWLSAYESRPDYDFYDIIVRVWNGVYTDDIQPSALRVRVDIDEGHLITYWPEATYSLERTSRLQSPCNVTLEVPAGEISPGTHSGNASSPASYHAWWVEGEVSGRFVPIFEQKAEFCLHQVQVPEGSDLRPLATVTLVWSYRGDLQVYPIADRTVAVEAHQA